MKIMHLTKILSVITATVMALTLAGCGKEASESSTDTTTTTQPVITEEDKLGEVMEIRDISSMELVKEIKIGWSLGNTLDATGGNGLSAETSWGNPVTTKKMIDDIVAAGFNIIRIPVTWEKHFDEEYNIDTAWLDRVQQVVDYAIDNDAFVILNLHHESWNYPYYDNYEKASAILTALWTQIAYRFQNYDEHLIFEGMNEPRKVGTNVEWSGGDQEGWDVVNKLNADFIATIRQAPGNNPLRHLMIPTYAANSGGQAMYALEVPDDDKVIVSLHAYIPYNFALSDSEFNIFQPDNTTHTKPITSLMELIDKCYLQNNIPVIIGEFGARAKGGNTADRALWAEFYVDEAQKYGIPCVWWDNNCMFSPGEAFGLYSRDMNKFSYQEIVDALMKAAYN